MPKQFAMNFLDCAVDFDQRPSWEHLNFPFRDRDFVGVNGSLDSVAVNGSLGSVAVNGRLDSVAVSGSRHSMAVNGSRESRGPKLRMSVYICRSGEDICDDTYCSSTKA